MLQGQNSRLSLHEWQPSAREDYVQVGGFTLLPASLQPIIAKHAIRMDYDYVKVNGQNERKWKFNRDQTINFEYWPWDRVNAIRVLEQLEK